MEHLLFIGIVLALVEWREVKQKRRYRAIEAQLKRNAREQERILRERLSGLEAKVAPLDEFVREAHSDLSMVVREYELNGIPLNLQRGKPQFDVVEGL